MDFLEYFIIRYKKLLRYTGLAYGKLYYWTFFKLFFSRYVHFLGQAGIRVHPSTSLGIHNSRIEIENGILSIGYELIFGSKGVCGIGLINSTLHTIGNVDIRPGVGIWATNANIEIGNGTIINGPANIIARKGIRIGSNCQIGNNSMILDCDLHKHACAGEKPMDNAKEIIIQDHCWVGNNVTILKGVTIGEGSIIGIRSVVTKDVEAHTMVAGVPARKIKDNVIWES